MKPEPAREGSDLVPNAMALAKALGVSAATIKVWKRKDGCPSADGGGRYRVSEWEAWVSSRDGITDVEKATKSELEAEILRVKLEDKKLDLALKKRTLEEVDKMRAHHLACVFAFRSELESSGAKLAPQVVGLTIPEAQLRIDSAHNEALMRLHLGEWAKP